MSDRAVHVTDEKFTSGDGWSGCTAQGLDRDRNADAFAVATDGPCLAFVVADGVGALAGSKIASGTAAAAAAEWSAERSDVCVADVPALLGAVSAAVGSALDGAAGGATTIACAIVTKRRTIVATVGDSEALAIGRRGPARRLHDVDSVPGNPNLLLAWIDGQYAAEPHIAELDRLPYRLCLVTDGITKVLDYARIADVARGAAPTLAARELVDAARSAGAKDDVTALVLSADVGEGA